MNCEKTDIDIQNEKDYIAWLKRQKMSPAEHHRRVIKSIRENPESNRLDMLWLKERLQRKHAN